MWASVGERGNVQTRGGNRVGTVSLLGCSTSVALTMGPTDEEEEHNWDDAPKKNGVLFQLFVATYRKAHLIRFRILCLCSTQPVIVGPVAQSV